ncbi:MAG: hypothetical protein JO067_03460 [Cupriavidus sp.]|nr:hypothetical protein [Cupriavidus sp.]
MSVKRGPGYIVGGSDGWLRVRRHISATIISLPEFLRIDITDVRDGRIHFVVREGVHSGSFCSVVEGNHVRSGSPPHVGPVRLTFSISKQQLTHPGGIAFAVTYPVNPIPIGRHPIQIFDFPHGAGALYLPQTAYALSWCYLGHGTAVRRSNDRYLHPGELSSGCVSVKPADWTAVYQRLVRARSGDGKTFGYLDVLR